MGRLTQLGLIQFRIITRYVAVGKKLAFLDRNVFLDLGHFDGIGIRHFFPVNHERVVCGSIVKIKYRFTFHGDEFCIGIVVPVAPGYAGAFFCIDKIDVPVGSQPFFAFFIIHAVTGQGLFLFGHMNMV